MRIVSLMPAATEILFAMGLGSRLVGRSHACDFPPEAADLPVVTVHDPESPERTVDATTLAGLEPDLILTDGSDDDPLVDYTEINRLTGGLERETTLVALAPQSVEGMFNAISTVGAYTEAEYEAVGLVEILRERLRLAEPDAFSGARRVDPPRRVVVLEGLAPLLTAGRWVPELVRRAGGWELLGREGEPSTVTGWDQLRDVEPDVLILALRDHDAAGAAEVPQRAALPAWFDELEAVRDGEFFAVDGHGLLARPGPRLIDGIAVLAELFDPERLAGAGPVEAWLPLAPVGLAGGRPTGRSRR